MPGWDESLYAAVEAGGTKFVCLIGAGPEAIRAQTRIPTTSPEATLRQVLEFFRDEAARQGRVAAAGVASFGPLDLHPSSPTYGFITSTPKPLWARTDMVGPLRNAAARAEWRWGAARGLDSFIYLTVGTGIGGGGLIDGAPMRGLVHPEMGHLRIPHDREADPFAGSCPFHRDCLEGLASGPAMEARWGARAETLADGHPAWLLEARYLGLALANFICTLSPERIVIGGGVMERALLLPMVRREVEALLAGYIEAPEVTTGLDDYVVAPALGGRAGVLGALALAQDAASAERG